MTVRNHPGRGESVLPFRDVDATEAGLASKFIEDAIAEIQIASNMRGLHPHATQRLASQIDLHIRAYLEGRRRDQCGWAWLSVCFEFHGDSCTVLGWILQEKDLTGFMLARMEADKHKAEWAEEADRKWEEWKVLEAVIVAERRKSDWKKHLHPQDLETIVKGLRMASSETTSTFRDDLADWLAEDLPDDD